MKLIKIHWQIYSSRSGQSILLFISLKINDIPICILPPKLKVGIWHIMATYFTGRPTKPITWTNKQNNRLWTFSSLSLRQQSQTQEQILQKKCIRQ